MFSKTSRYRKMQDIVTSDAVGRMLASREVRLLPDVKGTFLHTVEETDRLDNLSYKYYTQSKKWWRICDANPEFPSPQALLGKETIVTDRFPLTFDDNGSGPPWAELLKCISNRSGVEDVAVEESIRLVPQERPCTYGDQKVTTYDEQYERAVVVTYDLLNITAGELADAMAATGFEVSPPANIGRIGKTIVIPPNIIS